MESRPNNWVNVVKYGGKMRKNNLQQQVTTLVHVIVKRLFKRQEKNQSLGLTN